jgi:hypothetical protein
MRIVSDPRHSHKEWYEELCALAAIGELSSSENEELQQHLAHCGECRRLSVEFQRIAADDLGSLAVLKKLESTPVDAGSIDEEGVLAEVMERAKNNRLEQSWLPDSLPKQLSLRSRCQHLLDWLQRPALSYGAVAVLLCAVATIVGFRVRELQMTPTLQQLNADVGNWKSRTEAAEAKERSASEQLHRDQIQQETVEASISDLQGKYQALEKERITYQAQASQVREQLGQREKELEAAKSSEMEKSKRLTELETKLHDLNEHAEQQEKALASLRTKLWDDSAKRVEAQSFDDADAKELFGARDLHIVDVYDVGSNGKTRRTYGRVYYVAKKLLIFYAFDLQDPRRNRVASGFQAWGYQQASETSPRSLGLFSLDDVAENRWVLKVNNPRVLERIDAVFVTLESPNGSPSPRGRRVLYANLAGPANHP